ncbi:hypothetical protein KIN20_011914 [Parelaphostrongylus tenuis]|uniref:Uncharacterized protein n=1 Tax=Parelaphostrongylus tenuis TaxID=148309 RepID=A0AAD5MU95_PARTN|nr:hypothetical protein KIN20_011914 [Parelaphostrongylus tenuis]
MRRAGVYTEELRCRPSRRPADCPHSLEITHYASGENITNNGKCWLDFRTGSTASKSLAAGVGTAD